MLIIDVNQVWDVPHAIEYVKRLAEIKPWFTEEPTTPDEYVLLKYCASGGTANNYLYITL